MVNNVHAFGCLIYGLLVHHASFDMIRPQPDELQVGVAVLGEATLLEVKDPHEIALPQKGPDEARSDKATSPRYQGLLHHALYLRVDPLLRPRSIAPQKLEGLFLGSAALDLRIAPNPVVVGHTPARRNEDHWLSQSPCRSEFLGYSER